jgi:hypothetical protein
VYFNSDMRTIIVSLFVLLFIHTKAQDHFIAIGIGSGDNITLRKYEAFYNFNYKLLYAKLNYISTPFSTSHYKNTNQTGLYLGVRSHPDLKLIGHLACGARYLLPTENINQPVYVYQTKKQINLFVNTGLTFNFYKSHSICADIYIGGVKQQYNARGNYIQTQIESDFMFILGYGYFFGRKSKQKE